MSRGPSSSGHITGRLLRTGPGVRRQLHGVRGQAGSHAIGDAAARQAHLGGVRRRVRFRVYGQDALRWPAAARDMGTHGMSSWPRPTLFSAAAECSTLNTWRSTVDEQICKVVYV
jgi:hypothetical protein